MKNTLLLSGNKLKRDFYNPFYTHLHLISEYKRGYKTSKNKMKIKGDVLYEKNL